MERAPIALALALLFIAAIVLAAGSERAAERIGDLAFASLLVGLILGAVDLFRERRKRNTV